MGPDCINVESIHVPVTNLSLCERESMAYASAVKSTSSVLVPTVASGRSQPTATVLPAASHLFVDNVRFWSMFSVVAIHCSLVFVEIQRPRLGLMEVVQTPFKFATIAFFLMSGFLAGRGLETLSPLTYLKRRMKRVALPWACWISMMIVALLGTDVAHHRVALAPNHHVLMLIVSRATYCLFGTAYWFVPNLLLSMAILLLFRRVHQRVWFGALLGCFSVFYGLNIYTNWVPSRHTESMLGFVFFLWLGTFASHHQQTLERWMARVSTAQLGVAMLFTGLLAYREATVLERMGSVDPLNSLRLTNQIFSIMAVLFVYKFRHATWPDFVSVRDNTFGVYLLHPLMMMLLWPVLKSHLLAATVRRMAASDLGGVALWVFASVLVYAAALLLTKFLTSHKALRWLMGLQPERRNLSRNATLSAAEPDLSLNHLPATSR